jgi:hypothetical protein
MEGFDYESSDGGIEILDDFTGYENPKNAAASSSTITSAGSSALKNLDTEVGSCRARNILQTNQFIPLIVRSPL